MFGSSQEAEILVNILSLYELFVGKKKKKKKKKKQLPSGVNFSF